MIDGLENIPDMTLTEHGQFSIITENIKLPKGFREASADLLSMFDGGEEMV
jgi:hypothetical protein